MNEISWDELFMSMVFLVAMKSKDNNTHVGAVIVDDKHRIISLGYNGLPRNVNDNIKERQISPEKYFWFEHAESNSILNTSENLEGCVMYTNGIPCADCARKIVQKGLSKVVVHKEWNTGNKTKWLESCARSKQMFKEAGIKLRYYHKPILKIVGWRNGEQYCIV